MTVLDFLELADVIYTTVIIYVNDFDGVDGKLVEVWSSDRYTRDMLRNIPKQLLDETVDGFDLTEDNNFIIYTNGYAEDYIDYI